MHEGKRPKTYVAFPCPVQVVSVGATNGSLSGTFRLRYGDQATVPLDANATASAVEVSLFENDWRLFHVLQSSFFSCGFV